jgi:putative Holliday junction resolvase
LYDPDMRVLGIDLGRKRVGLAVSDVTQTLARPLITLNVGDEGRIERIVREVERLAAEEDGLTAIVVGVPARLEGGATDATALAHAFVAALRRRTELPVMTEDERLTSREAESRLALGERDWRTRKKRLDAAAAAIILQDYLDRTRR